MQLKGFFEIFHRLPNGKELVICRRKNTVTHQGMTALAKVLSGQISSRINAMYFKFDSSGAAGPDSVAADTTTEDFHGVAAPYDYARATLTQGIPGTSDSTVYVANRAVFVGLVPTGTIGEINALTLSSASVITSMALVISPDESDRTQDLVYAVAAPAAVIVPMENSGVGMRWTTQFTVDDQ